MRHLPLLALALLAAPPIQAQTPAPAPPQCEAAVTQVVTSTDSVHVTTLTSCPVVVVRDTFVRVDTVAPPDTVTPAPPRTEAPAKATNARLTGPLALDDTTIGVPLAWSWTDDGKGPVTFVVRRAWNLAGAIVRTDSLDVQAGTVRLGIPPSGTNGWFCVTVSGNGHLSEPQCGGMTWAPAPPPDTVTPAPEPEPEPEPAPSPSGFPHLPSTYTRFAEHTFQALPSTSGSAGQIAGRWYSSPSNPRLTIQSDSRAPKSPSNVFQFRFYDGLTVGGSIGLMNAWATYENGKPPEYREFYESAWFRIPTPDFETPGPGMKLLGFWGVGQRDQDRAPGQVYMATSGMGVTAKMSSWSFDIRQQNQVSRAMVANRSSKKIRAGVWHRYEVQMVLNTIGQANGVLRFWLDNGDGSGLTLTHEYTNVVYRTSSSPGGFYGRQWDPTWGGMGGAAKTRHDYLWVDHLFLAGRRM